EEMGLSPNISLPAVLIMVLAGLAAGSTFVSGRIPESFDLARKRCVRIAWIGRAEFAAGEVEYDFS
ncbi:hypothetical protein B296_00056845, partial [Ensete ventricosum]